jgi:hypothetical protein
MEIEITTNIPKNLNALRTYETTYIYIGFRRFDVFQKKLQTITKNENKFKFEEVSYSPNVISRGYHTELVRITEYSVNPKIWKEEVGDTAYLFKQIQ